MSISGSGNKIKSIHTRIGDYVIALGCLLIMLTCVLPLLHLGAQSLSSPMAIINARVAFLPVEFSTESYEFVFRDPAFSRSMVWTAILTVIYTLASLAMTVLCAYPLTYDGLKGKDGINTFIIFTMYFSAGTIPNYILMRDLGLLNNPLVLILPGVLSVFNMIILRSFFYNVPISLRESAELDGAHPFTVLVQIYLPLSLPVLATLALFYAVGRWNGFADALLYLPDPTFHPIQMLLYNIINNLTSIDPGEIAGTAPQASEGMQAAAIMLATIPIVLIYPWLQRYFISGVSLGAVKG